jgi:general secretion pathway protein F/type IV pilus assembly protein PilC
MPTFTYVARNSGGEKISGNMEAANERDVINMLTGKSLFPVKVDEEKSKQINFSLGGGVSPTLVATFYGQLASLISNGVPLLNALNILKEQTSSQNLKLGLEDVIGRVEEGEQLGEAFARHPKIFNDMAVNMAKAGTEGGFLEDALERVSVFTEQQSELKSRTVGALIYPAILATMGTGVVAVLLIFFVPKFSVMFDQLKAKGELPIFTEYLLATSGFMNKYGLIFFVVLAVLYFILRVQLRSEAGRRFSDRLKLRLPMFGTIFRNLAVSRFCRVLGTLLKNGVPILKSLDISRNAAGNVVLSEAIAKASDNITSGESLSIPLGKSGQFPRNVTEMISVAEESNTLDSVLVNIAERLEKDTIKRLDLMVKLVEPIMLMIMAAVILVVVIALLLPVMKMGATMQ